MRSERFWKVATRYRPRGVRVRFKRGPKLEPAHATYDVNNRKEILTPRPDTREGLYMFLHECAHFILNHWYIDPDTREYLPEYLYEYEAEMFAHAVMRMEGIKVPKKMSVAAKKYISELAKKREANGGKVATHVARWLHSK